MSSILSITYEMAVTPTKSDSVKDPNGPFAALLVTATGDVKFTPVRGPAIALTSVAANVIIPIATAFVWSTGTTATVVGLLALPYKGGAV